MVSVSKFIENDANNPWKVSITEKEIYAMIFNVLLFYRKKNCQIIVYTREYFYGFLRTYGLENRVL